VTDGPGERAPQPLRLVVLVSGSGTTLQALLDASAEPAGGFTVVAVGADREGTGGVERAARHGIPTFVRRLADAPDRAAWDAALAAEITRHAPELVVSAGFMRLLGPAVLAAHPVLNTHPALLPSFPGTHGVRDALAHGVRVTGCTCHWVDAGVDTGPIVDQRAVRVEDGDTEATLHERIKVQERRMLVEVVTRLARDRTLLPAPPTAPWSPPRDPAPAPTGRPNP
jgi:phosphoribosylglycinamide formyltransferase-1